MSRFQTERFIKDFQNRPELSEEFTSLGDNPEAWVKLASTRGYELTLEQASSLCSSYTELSDDDLEDVAGGWDGNGGGGG